MIGRTVLHYKILAPLGSGGMGVVYLAEDERLGRQVALKFLPASWLQEPLALERFRVEARAASALSHPGICTIYDIGNDGDSPFIVMEALKGDTLRERIAKGALRVEEILEIGVQLTDALDAAHSRGIVHRDIKPANIFLGEKNRVKVLDFGVAKLGAASSLNDTTTVAMLRAHQAQMTTPGTAVGTVAYMSPEQARGDDVDPRTDLFSVGAVLYEMATGVQAFGGSSVAVIFDGILNRTPKAISQVNPLIPSQLEAVVAKALEKDRELRHQHASDLHAELKRIRRDFEAASLVASQPGVTGGRAAAAATTTTHSQVITPSRGRWYKTGALATLVVVTVGLWAWLERRGSEESAATPIGVEEAVTPGEAPQTPGAPAPAAPPAVAGPAPGRTVDQADAQPAPPARPQPTQPVDTLRQAPRPAPTPAGGAAIPAQPPQAPPTNTATVQPPTIPSAPAAEPPAIAGTARDNPPQPTQTPPSPITTPAPAAESRAGDTSVSPPAKPSVAPTDDEAAIRAVLRSYEQAIETKDIALYRSIRPRLTPAEEALVRNSFRQVDSQEVTIRVESLNIDGRTATVRIVRQDTLVTGGRRQSQNTTQTLQFEKTASGWVIN